MNDQPSGLVWDWNCFSEVRTGPGRIGTYLMYQGWDRSQRAAPSLPACVCRGSQQTLHAVETRRQDTDHTVLLNSCQRSSNTHLCVPVVVPVVKSGVLNTQEYEHIFIQNAGIWILKEWGGWNKMQANLPWPSLVALMATDDFQIQIPLLVTWRVPRYMAP